MKLTAFLLFLFMGLSACSEKNHSIKTAKEGTTLKVLTYNIHHANPPSKPDFIDLNAIATVILESGAELVALQEVDVNTTRSGQSSDQAQALAQLTGMEFVFFKGIDYQGGEYGTAILSKFPLLDHQRYELPTLEGVKSEPRTLAVATVDVKGTKMMFGNTHLDYTNAENNLLQVNKIVEILKEEDIPVILGGDFNAVPESASIQLLDQHFIRSCTENCAFTSPQSQPKRTIDYIMVSSDSNLEVLEHQVIEETYASDHRPVMATYRLGK
jgi:endonuclease/exonuclease/phosphatase family metal-dependent hydrolase